MSDKHRLHFQPLAYTVRVFEEGKSYEHGDPYAGVFTVLMVGKDAAHLTGLNGIMNRDLWQQTRDWLAAKGVKTITYDTHGGPRIVKTAA